jgi:hypothetical protein
LAMKVWIFSPYKKIPSSYGRGGGQVAIMKTIIINRQHLEHCNLATITMLVLAIGVVLGDISREIVMT